MDIPMQLTIFDKLLIFVLAVLLHWVLAINLGKIGQRANLKMGNWGPLITLRTRRGLDLIDYLARPRRFWRLAITAGIPVVIFGMVSFLLMLILLSVTMMRAPPEPSVYTAPRNVLLIPGINQFIPLVWGWLALFITMVVHEYSHGILCRVEGVRVKSMGLALLFLPVAAFVEPDEKELFGTEDKKAVASRGGRVRILSAGVIANFVVAVIAMALFFGPVIGAISPHDRVTVVDVVPNSTGDLAGFQTQMILLEMAGKNVDSLDDLYENLLTGRQDLTLLQGDRRRDLTLQGPPSRGVMIAYVFEDSPAYEAGMDPGLIILEVDGRPTPDWETFRNAMNTTSEGQEVAIGTDRGVYHLRLVSNLDGSGTGFMGVGFSGRSIDAVYVNGVIFQEFPASSFLAALQDIPGHGLWGVISFMALPFTGIPGFTEMGFPGFSGWISSFFEPIGWATFLGDKIFWIANLLFWVGLINLYAGLFNCLPAVPLDGGHIFRDLLHMGFLRIFRSEAKAEQVTKTLVAVMAWLIFSSLLFMILAPYLAHGFGT